ncbi:MAG: universal stress protein, partial [Thermodesulfobacteriota bacterium]
DGFDALVIGRYGTSPLKDLVFGSIAGKLISRTVGVHLWIVGGSPSPEKILMPLDSSDQSRSTVSYVGKLLHSMDRSCKILLLHVLRGKRAFLPDYRNPDAPQQPQNWVDRETQELEAKKTEMQASFGETIRNWERKGFDTDRLHSQISFGESRAGTIVDQARRSGYGTIVVGRRGLSRVEEFFVGRVSDKVLQLAKDRAVWIVHEA